MTEHATFAELWERLRQADESTGIEAKRASEIGPSVAETVSSFSNEPGRGGGYFLFGVGVTTDGYEVVGLDNPDKVQRDFVSLCEGRLSSTVRPLLWTDQHDGKAVIVAYVPEADPRDKPVYIKNQGLPRGAYRRIGSSDQHCTDDDIAMFYQARSHRPFDESPVQGSSTDDLDPDAIDAYIAARRQVNARAVELDYAKEDLLLALGALVRDGGVLRATVAGLMLFGRPQALRRYFPMARIDYIRVPGQEWVEDPRERYQSVEWLEPLMTVTTNVIVQIMGDIPRQFSLPEGEIFRRDVPVVPLEVIREAVVNALMHRSYRVNQPTQIIRYANRIELRNSGASLVPVEHLGEPGSVPRNPTIAAVLHDTGLAENKGTGIRTMREAMRSANLTEPLFDSDTRADRFTATLLVIHLFGEDDVRWLAGFRDCNLTEDEARTLVVLREIGAVNNAIYRDVNRMDTLAASKHLQRLRDLELLQPKGSGPGIYYVPGQRFIASFATAPGAYGNQRHSNTAQPSGSNPIGNRKPRGFNPLGLEGMPPLPETLERMVLALGRKGKNHEVRHTILALCVWRPLRAAQLAEILARNVTWLTNAYLRPMLKEQLLTYTHPDTPAHPLQAYRTTEKGKSALRRQVQEERGVYSP